MPPSQASLPASSLYNTCPSYKAQHKHYLFTEASLAFPNFQAELGASLLGNREKKVEAASLDNSYEREQKNEAVTRGKYLQLCIGQL